MDIATYLFIDTETGGINPPASLLSFSAIATDVYFNVLDELTLNVKPDDNHYVVNPKALEINGIDIRAHQAYPYFYAMGAFNNFLKGLKYHDKVKLVPAGWNVQFDIKFLRKYVCYDETWNDYIGYHCLDLQSVALFSHVHLNLKGLNSYLKHYGIANEQKHTAREDCLHTIELARVLAKRSNNE